MGEVASEWRPIRVRIRKALPCRLVCPLGGKEPGCREGPLYSHAALAGKWGWIIRDMVLEPFEGSSCGHCKRLFPGRNVAVEQGATLCVVMDQDIELDGSYPEGVVLTLSPEEVRLFGTAKARNMKGKGETSVE